MGVMGAVGEVFVRGRFGVAERESGGAAPTPRKVELLLIYLGEKGSLDSPSALAEPEGVNEGALGFPKGLGEAMVERGVARS